MLSLNLEQRESKQVSFILGGYIGYYKKIEEKIIYLASINLDDAELYMEWVNKPNVVMLFLMVIKQKRSEVKRKLVMN